MFQGFFKRGGQFAILFVVAAVLAPALFGQEDAGRTYSMGEKLLGVPVGAFGILIHVLLLLTSVFMFGWAIECFVNIRRDKLTPPQVLTTLQNYISEGDLEGALQYCESSPGYVTRVIGAALNRATIGPESVKDAAAAAMSVEQGRLEKHISVLSLLASTGTLQGLFGTVSGMVVSFQDIENSASGQVNPKEVAGGISMALMCTCIGLVVAIPALCFYTYFKNRVSDIGASTGLLVDDMVETIAQYAAQTRTQGQA